MSRDTSVYMCGRLQACAAWLDCWCIAQLLWHKRAPEICYHTPKPDPETQAQASNPNPRPQRLLVPVFLSGTRGPPHSF